MLGAWNQRHTGHVEIKHHAGLRQPFSVMCTLMNQQRKFLCDDKQEIRASTEMRDGRTEQVTLTPGVTGSDLSIFL